MLYKAFISYSHSADGKLAPALQSGLQRFAKPFYRLRAMRVFRDQTSLRLTSDLWLMIQQKIADSEHFILMASPEAAESEWVQKEVEEWSEPQDNLLENFHIVLTEGEIVWDESANDFDWKKTTALPSNLKGRFENEPLYLDFRWAKESEQLSLRDPQFLRAIGMLVASIQDKPLDSIIGQDVRQHRIFKRVAGTIIAVLTAFLATAIGAFYYANQQTNAANEALRGSYIENGRQELINNNPFKATAYLTEAYQISPAYEDSDKNSSLLFLLGQSMKSIDLMKFSFGYDLAEFSPDGKMVIAANKWVGKTGNTPKVWDVKTGKVLAAFNHARISEYKDVFEYRFSAKFSPDNSSVVTASESTVNVWDIETEKMLASFENKEIVSSAIFSPDSKKILITGKTAKLWDIETDNIIFSFENFSGVRSADFSPDGKIVITAHKDGIRIWDIGTKKLVDWLEGQKETGLVRFSSDGRKLLAISDYRISGKVKVWNLETKKDPALLANFARSAEFSPDGKKVVVPDGINAEIWDIETEKLIVSFEHRGWVNSASFSPDNRLLVTASDDLTTKVWDIETGKNTISLQHEDKVNSARFSPDGKKVATGGYGKHGVWSIEKENILHSFEDDDYVSSARFSPDSKRIVTTSRDKTAKIWNLEREQLVATFLHPDEIRTADFSPNGKQIVTISRDTAQIWDIQQKKALAEVSKPKPSTQNRPSGAGSGPPPYISSARFLQSGKPVAIKTSSEIQNIETGKIISDLKEFSINESEISSDGKIVFIGTLGGFGKVYTTKTGKVIANINDTVQSISSVKFSPDNKQILTKSLYGNTAKIWNVETESVVVSLQHEDNVKYAMFSPNGKQVISASDEIARVWDVETGKLLLSLIHEAEVRVAEFSPDGRKIVTISNDKTIKVWDVSPEIRTSDEIKMIIEGRLPYRLVNGILVPR